MKLALKFSFFALLLLALTSCDEKKPKVQNKVSIAVDTAGYNTTTQFVNITSDESWVATLSGSDPADWCTINPTRGSGNGVITLSYSKNGSDKYHKVSIDVAFSSQTISVDFVQDYDPTNVFSSDKVHKWMELPKVDVKDSMAYISHYTNISGKGVVRNYSMLYDGANRIALWVAYPLCGMYRGSSGRSDEWAWNPKIPLQYQYDLSSSYYTLYGLSGYDRGHQIPSADRTISKSTNADTFFYTNMTAQFSSFNSGIWGDLENGIRDVTLLASDTLYIVTGPILRENTSSSIKYVRKGGKRVTAIPYGYFKVLLKYDKAKNDYTSIGFVFKNVKYARDRVNSYDTFSVKEVEAQTGYSFFTNLPADKREAIISQKNPSDWAIIFDANRK